MFRPIFFTIAGAIAVFMSLVACNEINANIRAAERHTEALEKGQATLAACIADQCKVLDLDGMRLEDYSVINELTHVTVLMASRTDFSDLNDIGGMSQLKELHITRSEVTDLSGLRNFSNLILLHAQYMPTEVEISPIAQLTGLTELALGQLGEKDDASFIQNMKKLENLIINWQGVEMDLEILRGHPTLRNVVIRGTLPEDHSALLTLPKLEAISIGDFRRLNSELRATLDSRGLLHISNFVVDVC